MRPGRGELLQAGAVGVGCDLLVDLEGECEGGASGFSGDSGRRAVAHGVEEVFEFKTEGFGALEF